MRELCVLLNMIVKKNQEDLNSWEKENGELYVTKVSELKKPTLLVSRWDSPEEMCLMVKKLLEGSMPVLVIMEKITVDRLINLLLEKLCIVKEMKDPLKNVSVLSKLMIVDIILMPLLNVWELEMKLEPVSKKKIMRLVPLL